MLESIIRLETLKSCACVKTLLTSPVYMNFVLCMKSVYIYIYIKCKNAQNSRVVMEKPTSLDKGII